MELFLDADDERSLSTQLYDQIREAIVNGRMPPGGRLQPSRAVAQGLAIARSTVTDAYARLTAEGYIEGRRGGGSIVLGHASSQPELSEAPSARWHPPPGPPLSGATASAWNRARATASPRDEHRIPGCSPSPTGDAARTAP